MKDEIERYSLSSNMILHGPEPDYIEVIKLFKMSRINIFLSYIEGWGLVPIEGLACGIPVIAYDLEVYNENIRNCEAAFIVPRGDFSETSKTILWLLSKSDKELNKLGKVATRFASQYDWDSSARKTFNVLEKIAI
jgi:glycosyltransferase involved in cell wall biosynthesis